MSTPPPLDEDPDRGRRRKLVLVGALLAVPVAALCAVGLLVVLLLTAFAGAGGAAATNQCATPGIVAGGSNVDSSMRTLMSRWGLKAHQAAGLVGNWQVEATPAVDPRARNELGYMGIAQWDPRNRWPRLQAFAAAKGLDPLSLDAQVRFAAWELGWNNEWAGNKGGYGAVGIDIKGSGSADDAARIVFDRYEIPGDSTLPQRQAYARGLATKYAVSSAPGGDDDGAAQPVEVSSPTAGGGWRVPTSTSYRTSSGFGPRRSPGGVGSTNHQGIDLVMSPAGSAILAAAAGTVKIAQSGYGGLGTAVIIEHGGGWATTYGHMRQLDPAIRPGSTVKAGQRLGWEGTTGNSTGVHLHFGVQSGGRYIDPVPFMASKGVPLNGKPGAAAASAAGPVDACTPGTGDSDAFQATLQSYIWPTNVPDGRLTPTPGYATAVTRAEREGRFIGHLPDEPAGRPRGIHCSGFLSLLMRDSGFDPTYNHGGQTAAGAGFVSTQLAWLETNWQSLGAGKDLTLSQLRPGDVGISNGGGLTHVWVYIGRVPGIQGNFAEASYLYGDALGFAPQARESASVLYANQPNTKYFRKKS